jgi:hypothetical protein
MASWVSWPSATIIATVWDIVVVNGGWWSEALP